MDFAIRTTNLSKHFGELVAVDGVAIEVAPGSLYGLVGPNGAGKSTLVNMLTGLMTPTSGTMEILGEDFDADSVDLKRRLGVMPEELALCELLTGEEFLHFVGMMYGLERQLMHRRAEELLVFLDLQTSKKVRISQYSGGMKKKISLAAALIHNPDLLFLDEPFTGLDPVSVRAISNVLAQMARLGSTVFVTSHMLAMIEQLCTHIGIIHKGQIVFTSSVAEVRSSAQRQLSGYGNLEQIFLSVTEADERRAELSWLRSDG